jgi:hypothetical protein
VAKQDVLAAQQAKADAAKKAAASGPLQQQTTITYSPTSMADGRTVLASVLQQALGRNPTSVELSDYIARLHSAENKSPTRTVTNYVRDGSSQTSTSRTSPSTADPKQIAAQFAAEIGGGTEMFNQQSNTYLDNLMQMLMGAQRA